MDYMRGRGGGAGGAGDRVLITLYEMIETREEELGFTSTILAYARKTNRFSRTGVFFATCLNIVYYRSYYRIFRLGILITCFFHKYLFT